MIPRYIQWLYILDAWKHCCELAESHVLGIFGDSDACKLFNVLSFSLALTCSKATVINATVPKFFANRMLWEAREYPSRIYGWQAFTTAQILCEIPYAILACTVYFLVWYFPVGFPIKASISGYVYLMWLLFNLFVASWGQWISKAQNIVVRISNNFRCLCSVVHSDIKCYSLLLGLRTAFHWCHTTICYNTCVLEILAVLSLACPGK